MRVSVAGTALTWQKDEEISDCSLEIHTRVSSMSCSLVNEGYENE